MPSSNNIINGAIVLTGFPDIKCYQTLNELITALPSILGLSLDSSKLTNVVVSNIQPLSGQENFVWFRMSNGGVFIGIYIYSGGAWRQVFPAPGQIYWVYGDSANPPNGFILTDDAGSIPAAVKNHLKTFWYPAGAGPWTYFSVVQGVN